FKKGSSLLSIVRRLRNGQQTPVNLVITKLRTREDLARLIGRRFETDSAQMIDFLTDPDSLRAYNVDPETATWHVLPDTYTYYWNSSPSNVYNKLYQESQKFWNEERKAKAAALGITPLQAYILASIVEEETNFLEEKDTIASVYINRVRMGMPLQADPTVKFAVRDFSITWVHGAMLQSESPYNTYRVKGLPPGPICTPSKKTIDEVLKAPQTNYLYFVASSRFDGTHMFSASYDEHMVKARAYQAEDKRRREARAAKKETAN
ncbi:MAG TPA: endolytic transglycosylase MltG, partial [Flavisolibacter sp.]|nr:endolytic transglycosylase MltG [Flavisolibacter sp.]